jgi:hypothetical protein
MFGLGFTCQFWLPLQPTSAMTLVIYQLTTSQQLINNVALYAVVCFTTSIAPLAG